jgi:hypothetical protein
VAIDVKGNAIGLSIWNKVQATDPKYTKSFSRGGGFKGTATNATWLAKRATETFGPMGLGWGVKVLDESILDGANGEKIHRVHVELWYMLDGNRGSIEHYGMTTFIGKNKNGQFTDEEAPKKSLTDAMSKCLSLLGFAADVHLGMFDDNKYVNAVEAHYEKQEAKAREERAAARQVSEAKPEPTQEVKAEEAPDEQAEEAKPEPKKPEAKKAANDPELFEMSNPEEDEEYAKLSDEQKHLVALIDKAGSVSAVTNLMQSEEIKQLMANSTKPLYAYLKGRATRRLKSYGWPNVQKIAADAHAG